MTQTIIMPSRDLQRRTREVLNATLTGGHVQITRWNRPEAVVVPAEWYARAVKAMDDAEQNK